MGHLLTTQRALAPAMALFQDENGQDMIEYALVAGLIGLSAIVSMNSFVTKVKTAFNTIGSTLTSAV